MTYPKVNRSHIVPQLYLRNFAVNEQIALRLVGEPTSKLVSVRDAAVRRAFYRRTRPGGEEIDDIEWSLTHVEDAAAPLLRELPLRWPLPLKDKATLAEFFAVQLVRGPRWHQWYDEFLPQAMTDQRTEGLPGLTEVGTAVAGDHIASVEEELGKATSRHMRMLGMVPKAASVFASMSWTPLRFHRPLVATCDHPVVVWPLERTVSKPIVTRVSAGLLPTLEVRVPVSPYLAILMSWRFKDSAQVVAGKPLHARNLNAFTVAHAERQWFYQPGTSPPIDSGRLLPLAPMLHADYDHEVAASSPLRDGVSRRIQPKLGRETEGACDVVTIRSS